MTIRDRSRINIPPQTETCVRTNQNGWVADYEHDVASDTESMTDVVTPGFHKRIAAGEIINNACSYTHQKFWKVGHSSMFFQNRTYPDDWNSYDGGNQTLLRTQPIATAPKTRDVESVAKVRALAHIDRSTYAFGEDIGEIRETIRFLRHPAESLHKLADEMSVKVLKRDYSAHVSRAKAIADVWTTYRFAATPFVISMMDALEAFNQGIHREHRERLDRLTARGFDDDSAKTQDTHSNVGTFTYVGDREYSLEVKGHAQLLYSVINPAANWRFNLGLRNKDIPLTTWQLVPLSFMVDRVLDISTAIQAAMNIADPSVSILSGSYTQREEHVKMTWTHTVDAGPIYDGTIDGSRNFHSVYYHRRKPWSPSLSDVTIPFDKGGLTKDVTSIVDLLAITLQKLRF